MNTSEFPLQSFDTTECFLKGFQKKQTKAGDFQKGEKCQVGLQSDLHL